MKSLSGVFLLSLLLVTVVHAQPPAADTALRVVPATDGVTLQGLEAAGATVVHRMHGFFLVSGPATGFATPAGTVVLPRPGAGRGP